MAISTLSTQPGRPAQKRREVLAALREGIVSGELPPGARLPTRRTLEQRFGVSCATVQQVLNELRRLGFIDTCGRRGTFVAEAPPHLSQFAIAFAPRMTRHGFKSGFDEAIYRAATLRNETEDAQLRVFTGISEVRPGPALQELTQLVEQDQLAGLIFAEHPFEVRQTALLDRPGLPRVALASQHPYSHVTSIYPDYRSFLETSLQRLAQMGRKRVGAIMAGPQSSMTPQDFCAMARDFGLTAERSQVMRLSPHVPEGARDYTHLVMDRDTMHRPDALIVGDDHMIGPVSAALLEMNIAVPDDLAVVCHANLPYMPQSQIPVEWVGFDVHELLGRCLSLCRAQRRGESVPAHVNIAARQPDPAEHSTVAATAVA